MVSQTETQVNNIPICQRRNASGILLCYEAVKGFDFGEGIAKSLRYKVCWWICDTEHGNIAKVYHKETNARGMLADLRYRILEYL